MRKSREGAGGGYSGVGRGQAAGGSGFGERGVGGRAKIQTMFPRQLGAASLCSLLFTFRSPLGKVIYHREGDNPPLSCSSTVAAPNLALDT